jgi:Tat protein translocase TatB subunit
MLNVGPLELLVVLAVALIVVGPERLPDLARSVGKALRQLRQVQDEVRDMVSMGIDDDVRRAATDLKKATGDLTKATDVKGTARRASRAARTEARRTLEPARRPGSPSSAHAPVETDVATPAVTPDVAPIDGPAEPDAPTAADGSALEPTAPEEPIDEAAVDHEIAGPPAERLVEDPAASSDDAADRP